MLLDMYLYPHVHTPIPALYYTPYYTPHYITTHKKDITKKGKKEKEEETLYQSAMLSFTTNGGFHP